MVWLLDRNATTQNGITGTRPKAEIRHDAASPSRELDPFTWGVLSDAWNTGARLWWLKRARDFDLAKPLPGQFHGNATREQLSARWKWCDEVARACRAKAEIIGMDDEIEAVLRDAA